MKTSTNIPIRTRPSVMALVAVAAISLLSSGHALAEEPKVIEPAEKPAETIPRPTEDVPQRRMISPDFDGSGSVDVRDLFTYLSAWFAGKEACDTNRDGVLHVNDLFAFLSLWLSSNGAAMTK